MSESRGTRGTTGKPLASRGGDALGIAGLDLGHLKVTLGFVESGESEVRVGVRGVRPHRVALVVEDNGEVNVRSEIVRVEGDGVPVLGLEKGDLGGDPGRLRVEIKSIVFRSCVHSKPRRGANAPRLLLVPQQRPFIH